MLVIIFAAAGKTGLIGVNGTLLVDKYKQTIYCYYHITTVRKDI